MKSALAKRSIVLRGRKTSISLENPIWADLRAIARSQGDTLSKLIGRIDASRQQSNLSSAVRVFVLLHLQNKRKQADLLHSDAASSQPESEFANAD